MQGATHILKRSRAKSKWTLSLCRFLTRDLGQVHLGTCIFHDLKACVKNGLKIHVPCSQLIASFCRKAS